MARGCHASCFWVRERLWPVLITRRIILPHDHWFCSNRQLRDRIPFSFQILPPAAHTGTARAWWRDLYGSSRASHVCALCWICFSSSWQLGAVKVCGAYQEGHGCRRQKPQLRACSSQHIKTRETEGFSRGKRGWGVGQKQGWDSPYWAYLEEMDQTFCCIGYRSCSELSPSPWPLPRVLMLSYWSSLFYSIIIWKYVHAGTLATRHYFISSLIALYKLMDLNIRIYTCSCTVRLKDHFQLFCCLF